jgi:anti-sigma factor RsiW
VNCEHVQALLDAYLDEELERFTAREVERHLDLCSRCSQTYDQLRQLQNALRVKTLYAPSPAHLRQRVQRVLDTVEKAEPVSASITPIRKVWKPLRVAVALLAFSLLCLLTLFPLLSSSTGATPLAQEVLASYQHALQNNHQVDVSSSDQQRVKAWFAGKLTYTLPAIDVTRQGFALLGGRLAFLKERAVAVLVYRQGTHITNLFLWPASGNSSPELQTLQGYHLCSWTQSGLTYWAVSTLDVRGMQYFVHSVQKQTT